ncbi:hypothetical protein [Catenuloplanes indicus]|uniref:Uncharacterized protein n=1 Tax=Catenuloplanes indicus TaxID=137267 RepID=A0AAE4B115_9ACTN|nr:hypothetical protein [Catenuloplanes indicus]MDQ0370159.1 hypothetical protein [Catenuloplanes indicus]
MAGTRRAVRTRRVPADGLAVGGPRWSGLAGGLLPQVVLLVLLVLNQRGEFGTPEIAPFFSFLAIGAGVLTAFTGGLATIFTRSRRMGIGMAQGTGLGVVLFFAGAAIIHP